MTYSERGFTTSNVRETIAIADFDQAILQRLEALKPTFLAIRSAFGIGAEVGLGSLPAQGAVSAAALPQLIRNEDGSYSYQAISLFSIDEIPLGDEGLSRIVVMPFNPKGTLRIVSIHQVKGFLAANVPEESLLSADDSVYEGLIAHELAHVIADDEDGQVQVVKDFLKQREDDLQEAIAKGDDAWVDDFDIDGEAKVDIIASLMGYRTEIAAKNNYMLNCLSRRKDAKDIKWKPFSIPTGKIIRDLNRRIREFSRYCQ